MRILVISDIRGGENSGGRRHGLICALALAEAGRDVTYVCSYPPAFYEDCKQYFDITSGRFNLVIDPDFMHGDGEKKEFQDYDLYIGYTRRGAERAALYGKAEDKPSVSAIFEAQNWVEDVYGQPQGRKEEWQHWPGFKRTILDHDKTHTVDLTNLGREWTKKWLDQEGGDFDKNRQFQVYAIGNNRACDKALIGGKKLVKFSERKDQILFIGRMVQYKGYDKLIDLFIEGKLKSKLVILAGSVLSDIRRNVELRAEEAGIDFQILENLSEEQKFGVIKESRLVVLPSLFEGQGLPIIEASMCLTPSVVFDLPVYDEQHSTDDGDMFPLKAEYGNWESFNEVCFETLRKPPKLNAEKVKKFAKLYRDKFSVEYLVDAMGRMVSEIMGENKVEVQRINSDVSPESELSEGSIGERSITDMDGLGDSDGSGRFRQESGSSAHQSEFDED